MHVILYGILKVTAICCSQRFNLQCSGLRFHVHLFLVWRWYSCCTFLYFPSNFTV